MPAVLALALILVCVSCNSDSLPTSPIVPAVETRSVTANDVAGTWRGSLTVMPGTEDWTSARLTLRVTGNTIEGELQPRAGAVHRLSGTAGSGYASLTIHDLPSDSPSPCFSLGLNIQTVELRGSLVIALNGTVGGRCPSTILSRPVRLERV